MVSPLPEERARIGLILPSSNRLSEPQFNRYAPPGVYIHATRLRNRGEGAVLPMDETARIEEAALSLADAGCDLIAYHCTGAAMGKGVAGEREIVEAIAARTGRLATSTAAAIVEALRALEARRIVFISPSSPDKGGKEVEFLLDSGFEILAERALGLVGAEEYSVPPPSFWVEQARLAAHAEADAYFFACTTTQSPEAVEEVEALLGRPAVTSNQATLWCALRMLSLSDRVEGLGALMARDLPARQPA